MASLATLLLVLLQVPPPEGVKVANERVILNTPAGAIALALYPEVAPQNVKQVMKLIQAGVYDGAGIVRIEPRFVMQFSSPEMEREPPLPANLRSLIVPLPLEASSLKHKRGVVSMAREDGDVNSARTSFSILLGDAPHLDGKYTIIGHVEYGMDVVDELIKAPLNGTRPMARLPVINAGLVTGEKLKQFPPPAAKVIFVAQEKQVLDPKVLKASMERMTLFSVGVAFMIVCSLIPIFVPKITPQQAKTFSLMTVLIGAFLLVGILQPLTYDLFQLPGMTNAGHALAIFLFFGLLGVFRLMSRFESAA